MAKAILQSVGDETVAFDDQCYWVADNVKKFLSSYQAGMEVDITVKEIEGTPMVTFIKKAGFPTQPTTAKPATPAQFKPAAPITQPQTQRPPAIPGQVGLKGDIDMLTAAICLAYGLDVNAVKEIAKILKQ